MSDQIEDEDPPYTTVVREQYEEGRNGPKGLLANATSKHVAAVAWMFVAGTYGYAVGRWAGFTSEFGGVMLLFGVSLGVAMTLSVRISMEDDDDE